MALAFAPRQPEGIGYNAAELETVHDPRQTSGGLLYPHEQVFSGVARIAEANVDFRIETPEVLTDNHPVIIVNGYMGKGFGYSFLRKYIAEQGRVSVSVNPPRRQGPLSSYHHSCATDPMKLLSQGVYGVVRELQTEYRDLVDASKVDLVVHSMGLPVGILFALRHPGIVRNIVNVEGAGIEEIPRLGRGIPPVLRFLPRIHKFNSQELIPFAKGVLSGEYELDQDMRKAAISEAHYILAHPIRTVAEGLYVGSCDVRKPLDRIQRQQGIGCTALFGATDTLIPAEISIRDGKGLFSRFDVLDLGHLGPMTHPKETAAAAVDHLFDAA